MEGYGNENPGAFQPTRPLRGATYVQGSRIRRCMISTHAPLAGRDVACDRDFKSQSGISTHAPLAGRDIAPVTIHADQRISTHAPLAGRDSVTIW